MIGRIIQQFRQKFGHGLRTAYFRDVARWDVLRTPPVAVGDDGQCEIHVLTSASDWVNCIWALKSFYRATQRPYHLCIHDDGTLPEHAQRQFQNHFPKARLISRAAADLAMEQALSNYPKCQEFRRANSLAPKVLDAIYYLQAERMLLLDSDVLFFESPNELLRRIDFKNPRNSANPDCASAYTIDPETVSKRFGFALAERFNSGLALIHTNSVPLDWVETFLELDGIHAHPWRVEQTLLALCSSRYGLELLPEEYAVRLQPGIAGPCKHYVGRIRHLFYKEGIPTLIRQGFLEGQ